MSKRVIEIEIIGDSSKLKKSFGDADGTAGKFGSSLGKVAKVGGVVAAGLGVAVAAGASFVKAAEESNKVSAQTNAVLKSTGGVANVTAKQVGDLATTLSRKTSIDDEAVQSASNMLLTFTNVRNEVGKGNDIFTQATKTVLDMSVATGVDATKASVQLGKALNDPIKGIGALSRVGVTFTTQQKEQIATMVKAGDTAGAQKVILHELGKEFGGSAEAGKTASGNFKIAIGNLEEKIGNALLPTINKLLPKVTDFVDGMVDGTGSGGKLVKTVGQIASKIGDVVIPVFNRLVVIFRKDVIPVWNVLYNVLDKVLGIIGSVSSAIGKIPGVGSLLGAVGLKGHATGTMSSSGGFKMVGERGPELVAMPRGARVYNANDTRAMFGNASGEVHAHFHGPISSVRAARAAAATLAYKLKNGTA